MPVMTAKLVGTSSLIDECLPIHDFSAAYELRIDAPPRVIYENLLNSDFSEPWLVHLLMSIRSGRRLARNRVPRGLRERLPGDGLCHFGGRSEQGDRHWRCRSILASRWRAMPGTHAGGFCRVLAFRPCEGRMELQAEGRVA